MLEGAKLGWIDGIMMSYNYRLMVKEKMNGYTAEQAKLEVVWDNPNIASICSAMPNMTILQANVAAALNKQKLSEGDKQRLEQYAGQTAPGYCAGCANICESAVDLNIPFIKSKVLSFIQNIFS